MLKLNLLNTAQLKLNVLNTAQLKLNVLNTAQLKLNILNTAQLKLNILNTVQLKLNVLNTAQLKLNVLNTAQLKLNILNTAQLKLNVLNTAQLKLHKIMAVPAVMYNWANGTSNGSDRRNTEVAKTKFLRSAAGHKLFSHKYRMKSCSPVSSIHLLSCFKFDLNMYPYIQDHPRSQS
jgi:hypothetical protein